MNTETKDMLKGVGVNASGTLVAAGVVWAFAFFIGKINIVVTYWKEISLVFILIFVLTTLFVWFRKLVRLEKEVGNIPKQKSGSMQIDYSPEIAKTKAEMLTKINTLSDKLTKLDSDVTDIMREHLYAKAEKYQTKKQRGALLCRLQVVEMDIKNNSFELDSSLEELSNYIKGESVFSTQDLSEVKDILVKVSGEGKKEIAKHILELVKQKLP